MTFCRYRPSVPTVDIGTYRMHHLATAPHADFDCRHPPSVPTVDIGTDRRHHLQQVNVDLFSLFFSLPLFSFFSFLSFSSPFFFLLFLFFFFFFVFFLFLLLFLSSFPFLFLLLFYFYIYIFFTDDGRRDGTDGQTNGGGGGVTPPHPPPPPLSDGPARPLECCGKPVMIHVVLCVATNVNTTSPTGRADVTIKLLANGSARTPAWCAK